MKIINKILCKTTDFVFGLAEFVGMAIGLIVKYAIIFAFTLAAMVAALLLWLSVPYFTCTALFSEINSQWQVFAMFGIFGAWVVLSKIVYDRLASRK